jgi:L-ascorbate metabolism protein UlaG (beta-lactamase superfamily)
MQIVWYGLSCFRISERGKATVVTDPYGPSVGLPAIKLKADVVTISHQAPGHSHLKSVRGQRRVIEGPGEYEIGGVFITGIRMKAKNKKGDQPGNTIYVIDVDGLTTAHLGDLTYVPSQAQIENLGPVQIALVPVGGGKGLGPAKAAEVINLIEPSIVIPMHYKTGEEKLELGTITGFLSEMGLAETEPLPSLKLTKSGLSDETQVVVLEAIKPKPAS